MWNIIYEGAPEEGLVEVGPVGQTQFLPVAEVLALDGWDQSLDLYYSPALRRRPGGEKADVLGTKVLWVDIDLADADGELARERPRWIHRNLPRPILPPSITVWSGWGFHLYWVLEDWILNDHELIERANQVLTADTDADKCWNANRLLRVPGTRNFKHGAPLECRIVRALPVTYSLDEVLSVGAIAKKVRHKIRTGERRGHRSRSERDFAVLCELVRHNFRDATVESIFAHHLVGDVYRDPAEGSEYLARSLGAARVAVASDVVEGTPTVGEVVSGKPASELVARDDGYYVEKGRTSRRISTFTLEPNILLEADEPGGQDAIICDVSALGHTWPNVTFLKSAFASRNNMDKATPLASWQFLGRDDDVRALLPYLISQLEAKGLPRVRATSVLGLHRLPNSGHWFVGNYQSLSPVQVAGQESAPLVYLRTGRESPVLAYTEQPELRQTGSGQLDALERGAGAGEGVGETIPIARTIGALLPLLNAPETIWPAIGWYFASAFKPSLEGLGYRFPILNAFGTRGSGKTTTILRVFLPLLGQVEPKSYDANTTKFVILSLLGSTNAVPVAFSEFRQSTVDKFIRYILLSYDTGHDPRGRPDQTTQDYPLRAPFSVDGEDQIDDAAAKERMIAVDFHPDNVGERTQAWASYKDLSQLTGSFNSFATGYLQSCLELLDGGSLASLVTQSRQDILSAFPSQLPDRIRNNLSVCWFGIRMFCTYSKQELPSPLVLSRCLENVYNTRMGRTMTMADEFVQDLINHLTKPKSTASHLEWHLDAEAKVVWFQLGPAYNWWLALRKRIGRDALGRDAIKTQLGEAAYMVQPGMVAGTWKYGVHIPRAYESGLDIPYHIQRTTLAGVEV